MSANANERFEALAAEFRRETGMLAPGKDSPLASGETDEVSRNDAWRKFLAKRNADPVQGIPQNGDADEVPPPLDALLFAHARYVRCFCDGKDFGDGCEHEAKYRQLKADFRSRLALAERVIEAAGIVQGWSDRDPTWTSNSFADHDAFIAALDGLAAALTEYRTMEKK